MTHDARRTTHDDSAAMPALWARLPEPFGSALDPERPWGLLGEALDRILEALPSDGIVARIEPTVHLSGDRIAIGKGTRIAAGAFLEGPIFVGEDVEIRTGAYLRGGCWLGDGAVVGAHTEVKRSILLPGARAPHRAYVGDSILGGGVNLGAGTVLSNFRHDGREVTVATPSGRLATGRRKLGAILGDDVETGCNSVLHPGVVVGRGTEIYPGVQLRSGIYPADSIIKLRQEIEVVGKAVRRTP